MSKEMANLTNADHGRLTAALGGSARPSLTANQASSSLGADHGATAALTLGAFSVAAKLGLPVPNLAPDVDAEMAPLPSALIPARPVVPAPSQVGDFVIITVILVITLI